MAKKWMTVVAWVALAQAVLAMNPVPLEEEDWQAYSDMLRDPNYRLPTTTRPSHYEFSITPYFESPPTGIAPFTFDGTVVIYITATQSVSEIVMHCNDLTFTTLTVEVTENNVLRYIQTPGLTPVCETPYSFLRIPLIEPLQLNTEYIVRSTYRGNIQANMNGFYRSWYIDNSGRRWMGTTQFQPGYARQAFPCYDEPSFKATFDITINREADFSPSISNMPIRSSIPLANGRISETFYTSPLTSTYLLAFIVSHYDRVATTTNSSRPFDIYARNNAGATGDFALEIGKALLETMEEYTNIPYYTMAPDLNMKQAAIPDFGAGAMENWGLLTYREALILYDPLNSNHFYRQRIANIISHEIAHMWFGNLVTCAWWDVLWLNEGFARYYHYYLADMVAPEMGYDTRFPQEQVQQALFADSIDTSHAMSHLDQVFDPDSVWDMFSAISYAKGASIIRMTKHLLSEPTLIKGLRNYLLTRQYDIAEPHHLFDALDAAALEDGALAQYNGVTVTQYFRTWSDQSGYPLLTVNIDQSTGTMYITQNRYERNTGVSTISGVWNVPVTWTRGGAPEFMNLKPSHILTGQASVIERGTTGNEWVIFNKQQSGFYRVNYDDVNWALITRALRGRDRAIIHELSVGQIVDDLFSFARANVRPYQQVLNILSFMEYEDRYAPWLSAISAFNWVIRRLAHDETNQQRLKTEIVRLSAAVTARLGFDEPSGEDYMTGLQRMYVNEFLCNVGHAECIAAARTHFQNWRNGQFLPANMRPWVYCTGLREGTADDFNFFWNRYLNEMLAGEVVVMLQAVGCTRDQTSLQTLLNAIASGQDIVRPQDHSTAISSAVTGNEENTWIAFTWLQNNLAQVNAGLGSASTLVSNIAARLLTENQITQFDQWLDANQAQLGAAYTTGKNGIASTRTLLQWSATRVPEITQYLDVGYEEVAIDDVTNPEEEPTTAAPEEPSPVPDSAALTGASAVSLLVALAINMLA